MFKYFLIEGGSLPAASGRKYKQLYERKISGTKEKVN